MTERFPGVIFPPDVVAKMAKAERRLVAAAHRHEQFQRHILEAVDRGDLLLSEEGLLELGKVQEDQRPTSQGQPSRQVRRDLELLHAATVVHRVALHGAWLVARAGRWDGTIAGAHEVSPGLLEPDPLG